ncbi:FtsW/RodA/SpoVE family cell cycle protein [Virgibacillus sp. LDC-1]|uniref:FtsW/RodA/SpoVE family cell cycle protein n=1 Tax=Virgibacillus sp. LDC-1 TaxID=3039856 RepID=UPI0024DE573C|nr:FtsW/RodA/SpoVE family cell cycle protein [Virgibacillus sp. LDC-1]
MNQSNHTKLNLDSTLIFIVILLGVISVFTIYSIEPTLPAKYEGYHFPIKQAVWYVLGGIAVIFVMLIDYDRFRQITWWLYGLGMVLLLILFFNFPSSIVYEANNAVSWIKFPVLGTIQPAEIMKIFLVLAIADVITRHNHKYVNRTVHSDLGLLVKIAIVSLPPMGLIAVQPDLGGFLVLAAIASAMILVSGIRWRVIFSIIGVGIGSLAVLFVAYKLFPGSIGTFLDESVFNHVASRFYGWIDPEKYPDSGFQLVYAMLAIGSGQLFGKGLHTFEVYIPERHTDMIFTAIAEQFGFIGASVVITLFFLLIYRMIHIGIQSNDSYGSYLVTGLIGMFTYQIVQNIGMSIQLLPITGLPLPFLSYGGTSTLTYLIAIGIVLNVHSRTRTFMFD